MGNPEKNIQRVRERFAQGGHDVPDEDIRRRYERSLENLPAALRLANEAWIYDNSGDEPLMVLETRGGVVVSRSQDEPAWVTRVTEALSADSRLQSRSGSSVHRFLQRAGTVLRWRPDDRLAILSASSVCATPFTVQDSACVLSRKTHIAPSIAP